MRAYISCCMRVCACWYSVWFWLLFYTYSILLVHSLLVFLFVPIIIYAVLCMCPHAHRCLRLCISFFDTQRRIFTKNEENTKEKGSWELKKKISMEWNERRKKLKKQQQQQQHIQCAFAVIEYSFGTFRCAPPYICFGVASRSSS